MKRLVLSLFCLVVGVPLAVALIRTASGMREPVSLSMILFTFSETRIDFSAVLWSIQGIAESWNSITGGGTNFFQQAWNTLQAIGYGIAFIPSIIVDILLFIGSCIAFVSRLIGLALF